MFLAKPAVCRVGVLVRRRGWRPLLQLAAQLLVVALFLDLSGLHRHLLEIDYDTQFDYPLSGRVDRWVQQLMGGDGATPDGPPPPLNQFNQPILTTAGRVCGTNSSSSGGGSGSTEESVASDRLVLVVKSAWQHGQRRAALRRTWCGGQAVQCAFVVAQPRGDSASGRRRLQREAQQYDDLVWLDFVDSYFNNTLKTVGAFRWAVQHCSHVRYFMFVDDDFYVSVPNVLRLIGTVELAVRRPPVVTGAPAAERSPDTAAAAGGGAAGAAAGGGGAGGGGHRLSGSHDSGDFLVGHVFHSAPHRHRLSKWYVSLSEYPFSLWPPYCTAGAYIVSRVTLRRLLLAAGYTRHFRFDDVYVGLLARKLNIRPRHTDRIRFWTESYEAQSFRTVVAAHGFADSVHLETVWRDQRRLGAA